jgi:hypothetical protein
MAKGRGGRICDRVVTHAAGRRGMVGRRRAFVVHPSSGNFDDGAESAGFRAVISETKDPVR